MRSDFLIKIDHFIQSISKKIVWKGSKLAEVT